ncbi:MAG: polyamine aminopropyltransferase [Thermodesulfobacteriota bacterium]
MPLDVAQWRTEVHENSTAFSVRYSKKLFEGQSAFQRVEILDTDRMGRVLLLDGLFMVTEKDHFIYHEMLVHPAMHVIPDPRRVLVIGGGDGGTVTELVKHPGLESVVLCEIDEMVVSSCREFMPAVSAGLDDPRVEIVCRDGAAFVREHPGEFDLILVDSTDPIGPGVVLFEEPFYESVKKALRTGGAAVFQTESPLFMEKTFRTSVGRLRRVFGSSKARPYVAVISSYPGGLWSFTFCSELREPVAEAPSALPAYLDGRLRYYDAQVHTSAFVVPVFVREALLTHEGPAKSDAR